jgi:hypothetical protein
MGDHVLFVEEADVDAASTIKKRGRKKSTRGDEIIALMEENPNIKGRASAYRYKNRADALMKFRFDITTFIDRHSLSKKDFAEIIGSPYCSIHAWMTESPTIPESIDHIAAVMRRVDAVMEKNQKKG